MADTVTVFLCGKDFLKKSKEAQKIISQYKHMHPELKDTDEIPEDLMTALKAKLPWLK